MKIRAVQGKFFHLITNGYAWATDKDFIPYHAHRTPDGYPCDSKSCACDVTVGGVGYFWYSLFYSRFLGNDSFIPKHEAAHRAKKGSLTILVSPTNKQV